MELELVQYIRLFRRWSWLIILGAFLSGGAAYLQASRQVDVYRAQAVLSVGTYLQASNPSGTEIYTGQALAQNYVVLARSYSVAQAAVEQNNLPVSAGGLRGAISAGVIEGTTFIQITASSTDPLLAVEMANAVAEQLIVQSPTNLTPQQQAQIDLANAEISRLTQQLDETRQRLSEVEDQMSRATDSDTLAQWSSQRDTLISQINEASNNIAQFSDSITRLQQRTNSLEIIEPARNLGALPHSTFNTALLGAIVGAALAIVLALAVEYLDDTIRSPEQVASVAGAPTLAIIPRFGKPRDSAPQRLIAYRDPGSPVSEEYRTLRTNLMFSTNGNKAAFLVTSPGPSEGKTVTACNLAITMATAGWRVLLIDADMRRPMVHEMFGLDNQVGLSTLLSLSPHEIAADTDPYAFPAQVADCIRPTEIPGLNVITSGYIPLNPTEILGSASMQAWFDRFRATPTIDVVIFDTPPVMVAADSAVLGSALNLPAVLILQAGQTRPMALKRAKERLDALDIAVKGVVLNAVTRRDQSYSYGYDYYYYYYYRAEKGQSSQK